MYIDTHAHLTDGAFDHDRQELIKGLAAGGIGKIIEISCDPKDFPVSAALAEQNPGIYLAFGIHPEFAESCTESDIAALENTCATPNALRWGRRGWTTTGSPTTGKSSLSCSAASSTWP